MSLLFDSTPSARVSTIAQPRVLLEVVLVSLGVWHPPQLELQLGTAKKRSSSGRAIYTLTIIGTICMLLYRACCGTSQLRVLCVYSMTCQVSREDQTAKRGESRE